MIDVDNWHWPQWGWVVGDFIVLIIYMFIHGKKNKERYNFFGRLATVGMNFYILLQGGFFK